ncbi:MAG: glycosyltransferase family 2 protein [Janthinobacterium lividum]
MSSAAPSARLGIVLVNYKGWSHTLECLESLFRSTIPIRVVVVDNASGNDSLDHIAAWARGDQPASALNESMSRFSVPPVPKPIEVVRLNASDPPPTTRPVLMLVDAGANRGFAGGNNIGLRILAADPKLAYFWLLNNDTVVEPGAAAALVARMDSTHNVGMCGTVIRYYHRPDRIQALNGGRFSRLTGVSSHIGRGSRATMPFDPAAVARDTDYVLGASLAVSRRFLERIGMMEESYFLYFEEIDWSYRNRGRFAIAFAHGAVIYHKEGGSIGSSGVKGERSVTSEYYLLHSRLAFVRRQMPVLLPVHWIVALGQIGRRVLRRQPNKALVMTRALLGLRHKTETRG